MEDKELQTILNSGGVNSIYLGGTTSTKKVQKKEDMTGANVSVDDTGLGVSADNVQEAFAIFAEVGLMVMAGVAIAPQVIGTSPTKVNTFDTLVIEEGVGVTGDVVNDKGTITLDGIFKVRFEAFVLYAGNVDIAWQIYRNGSPFGSPVTLPGQGATPFPILRIANTPLEKDDYIELYATASTSASVTIVQSSGSIEKTIF